MNRRLISLFIVLCIVVLVSRSAFSDQSTSASGSTVSVKPSVTQIECDKVYKETKACPAEMCFLTCGSKSTKDKCEQECISLECFEISPENCPTDKCMALKGCNDSDVCYDKMDTEPIPCGDLSYPWQDVECCEGLVKRCGIEFFDGTCDMAGQHTVYSVPVCLPCGNGICNQFENRCNCPEDCL
ncbi:MAG: hypothetical protein HQL27_07590 [Candidatus Omnitrophica bacterium]|nr:hypothetical protein [Candidatus Omnitrophota bacterium]